MPANITPAELEALEKLFGASTQGEWYPYGLANINGLRHEDAKSAAALHNAFPRLRDELLRLWKKEATRKECLQVAPAQVGGETHEFVSSGGEYGFCDICNDLKGSARQPWRVGSKVPLNVYEGDRPVCQCHTAEDARRIVSAMNTKTISAAIEAAMAQHPKGTAE